MASKLLLTLAVVVLAVVSYYATTPVPPGLSSSDSRTLRMFGFLITLGGKFQQINFEFGVSVSNFLLGLQGDLIPDDPRVTFTDTTFNNVKVRVYEPVDQVKPRAGLLYIHGGGWVVGNRRAYHTVTEDLAANVGNVVLVSIDYRMAWEAPFPASIDDVTDVATWFLQHIDQYHVDAERVAVAGDSAGGNLAAALCQRLTFDKTFKNLPKMQFQGLIQPALQAFDLELPSYQQNSQEWPTLVLTKTGMADFYSLYIQGNKELTKYMLTNNHTSPAAKQTSHAAKFISHTNIPNEFKDGFQAPSVQHGDKAIYEKIKNVLLDPDFSPIMRQDLRGLPPTYIVTAQYDVLRDDGILYAKRLADDGVEVVWRHYQCVHALMFLIRDPMAVEAGKQASAEFTSYVREKLNTGQ